MKKNMKKALTGAALTGAMLAALGMTGSAEEEKKFTIGFSDFSLSAEYQAKLRDKIVETRTKAQG